MTGRFFAASRSRFGRGAPGAFLLLDATIFAVTGFAAATLTAATFLAGVGACATWLLAPDDTTFLRATACRAGARRVVLDRTTSRRAPVRGCRLPSQGPQATLLGVAAACQPNARERRRRPARPPPARSLRSRAASLAAHAGHGASATQRATPDSAWCSANDIRTPSAQHRIRPSNRVLWRMYACSDENFVKSRLASSLMGCRGDHCASEDRRRALRCRSGRRRPSAHNKTPPPAFAQVTGRVLMSRDGDRSSERLRRVASNA